MGSGVVETGSDNFSTDMISVSLMNLAPGFEDSMQVIYQTNTIIKP